LLEPIHHRGPGVYKDRALLTARDALVQCRTALINSVRGVVKAIGVVIAKGSAPTFHRHAAEVMPEELGLALGPVLEQIESLSNRIGDYDKQVDKAITECYPEALRLQQIPGVGPVTSLAYVLAIEDPTRFKKSRDVGAYFGLVPERRQSGDSDPELRITKAGDRMVRSLLVQCAHYILGPFGRDCDLRRFGERIAGRGKKLAKRRAVVAVARKLAVLLHALWVHGSDYDPLRNAAEIAA
jgi:transposase